jgi:WD40 repeat protein
LGWLCVPLFLATSALHAQIDNRSITPFDQNVIETVEPGVQLIGRPKSVRNLLDSETFTMTPDGKMLVGARGRELCIIDWDAQELVRTVKMPFQHGSVSGFEFRFSNNGRYLLVLLRWYGRPYDPTDELDPDEFQDFRLNREFPYETFRGDRLLVYSSEYQLLHDLELTYDPTRIPDPSTPTQHWVNGIHFVSDNKRVVLIGSAKTRVIELESGKVVDEQTLHPWAIPVGDRIFDLRRQDGRTMGVWWDPASDEVSTDTELELPASPMPIRTGQAGQCYAVLDRHCSLLTIRSPDGRVEITVPKMDLLNTYAGTYSPDGQYYIFPSGQTLTLVDLKQQKIRSQFRLPSEPRLGHLFFRPHHGTLIVQYGSQLAEVSLDDDFETNLRALGNLLPGWGHLSFFNDDQFLAVGRDCVLNLAAGTTQVHENRHTDGRTFSPTSNVAVQMGYWFPGGGLAVEQIEIGPADSHVRRLLYNNLPALSPAILRVASGISDADSVVDRHGKWIGARTVHLSFSPDGETLRHVYIDSAKSIRLRLTQLNTRALLADLALESKIIDGAATVSPDGRVVAVFRDAGLEILDADTGQLLQEFALSRQMEQVCWDHSGDTIAALTSWHGKSTAHVIDLATAKIVLREDNLLPLGLGFRPGSDQFYLATRKTDQATRQSEKRLRFFDRETWEVAWEHSTPYDSAYGMAMSHDGTQAAFGLTSRHIELWKLSELPRQD